MDKTQIAPNKRTTNLPLKTENMSPENSPENSQKNSLENCGCHYRDRHLPDKFWDEANGKLRVKSLADSYIALEKRFSSLLQEKKLWEEEKNQIETAKESQVDYPCCPATADEYDISVDNGLFDQDPWINQILHEAGFSNEQVQLVYDLAEMELLPLAEELGRRLHMENDVSRLEQHFGGKARWRETSRLIRHWAMKNLPEQAYKTLSSSYEGILAMYAMIDRQDEPELFKGQTGKTGLEEKDLRRMMQSPKYWQERDPAFIRKVSDGFKRLYGN